MSELLNEQLSALVDGELPAAQTVVLLKRLEREPALALRLARYRLAADALRGVKVSASADFTLRVSAALAAEPAHARPRRGRRYLGAAGGLAVAATVAGVAILVLGRAGQPRGEPATVAAVSSVAPAAAGRPVPVLRRIEPNLPTFASSMGSEPASYVTPAAHAGLGVIPRGELANYVVAHSEVSGPLGLRSVLTNLVSDGPSGDGSPAQ